MRHFILAAILSMCLLFTGCSRHESGKWGYIDRDGKMVIKPQYDWTGRFDNGLAAVCCFDPASFTVKTLHYIDKNGKPYITLKGSLIHDLERNLPKAHQTHFHGGGHFRDGLAWVVNGTWPSYIDKRGKVIIKPAASWTGGGDFSEGRAAIKTPEHLYGYVDKTGKPVIKPQYYYAGSFSEGLAFVSLTRLKKLSKKSDEQKENRYSEGPCGFIDKSGKMVIKPVYQDARSFAEGLAAVKVDGKWGYIDKNGRMVLKPQWDWARPFDKGSASVCLGKGWGLIDKSGRLVVKPVYQGIYPFSEGLALVNVKGKWGFLDRSGKFAIKPQFEVASSFSNSRALVQVDERYGFIDKTGDMVIKPRYRMAHEFSEGLAEVLP